MEKELFVFPLSFSQERLWFLDQLQPNSSAYNIPLSYRMRSELNVKALERSLTQIVSRHEALRTTFEVIDGKPTQMIHPPEDIRLQITALDQSDVQDRETEARRLAAVEAGEPFRLDRGPLIRARLLRLAEQDHVLLLSMHHIISDGWSINVLLNELQILYEDYRRDQSPSLPPLTIQYADFAIWQREWLQGEVLNQHLDYWRQQLAGAPPTLEIPSDRIRPPVRSYRGEIQTFIINREIAEQLKQLARQEGVTLFMLMLAAFQVLLARYTGQWDVVVGTPVANRNRAELEGLIGFFVNTLLLRTRMNDDPPFLEVLRRVKETTLSAYAHQDLPFEKLVEELQPQRDLSRNPLFQVMFVFQSANAAQAADEPGLRSAPGVQVGTSKFDLTMSLAEAGNELAGSLEYDADLYDAERMRGMISHWRHLLEGIVAHPEQRVSRLPLLTEGERHRVVVTWNNAVATYDRSQCLHEMVERQAARTPDKTAIECNGESLSYRELNERSNRLAHALISRGVGPEVRVGLSIARTVEMLVGVLAVLKAGGAYVPLDPEYPEWRLNYMLTDACAGIVLTETDVAEALAQDCWSAENPGSNVDPENLAYVIYTSGSTGHPKGVAITHRSAVCFLTWCGRSFPRDALRSVLASTSLCFDLAVFELFAPLSTGGRVVLVKDALALVESSQRNGGGLPEITLINTVPSAMQTLLDVNAVPSSVQTVNLAGEALQRDLVERLYTDTSVQGVYNLYGPTEDTTYSTAGQQRRDATTVDIGRPISNTQVYLLDANMEPVPIGLPGELYLSGAGLARGYLNKPGQTAAAFVPNPFSKSPGARMYRTGDLARYGPNGRLYFLGRKDHQIKLRGFRIEIGEIETVINSHPEVREAVVMLRADNFGDSYLAAYVVSQLSASELRAFLRERLPEYMVPASFVQMKELPRTENGKIDRAALPLHEGAAPSDATFELPQTATEKRLADLWSELLSKTAIGIHDNFFSLGGHSLVATRLVSRLRSVFRIDIALRAVFEFPTIAELACEIERHLESSVQEPIPRTVGWNTDVEHLSEAEIDALLEELRREEGAG